MGSRNLLQMAEFDGFSQICKTGIQQQASAAEFGKIPAGLHPFAWVGWLEFSEGSECKNSTHPLTFW
eukprot:COSAG01_NODE_6700_length_3538_cov_2.277406_1_plen_67_part_00